MNRKQLTKSLIDKTDTAIAKILDHFMEDTDWGSDFEAEKLIIFIECLEEAIGCPKLSVKDTLNLFIKIGLTARVSNHFFGLHRENKPPSTASLELMKYGLFARDYITKEHKSRDRINNVARLDAESLISKENILPCRALARKMKIDPNTVKSDRKTNQYKALIKVMPKLILQTIRRRD